MKNSLVALTLLLTINTYCQVKLRGIQVLNDEKNKSSILSSKPVALEKGSLLGDITGLKNIRILFSAKMVDEKQEITPIRLINTYTEDDWLFLDEIIYKVGTKKEIKNGKAIEFRIKDNDVRRKVIDRGIEEVSFVSAKEGSANRFIKYILLCDNKTELHIKYVSNSKNKYDEVKVPKGVKNIKKRFKALVEAYNMLCKKTGLEKEF